MVATAFSSRAHGASFERTENREDCSNFEPLRRPFFGDTHIHTALSFDADGQGTRVGPADAYRFARGDSIPLPPYDDAGNGAKAVQLRRPLDFAVVTDHSDLLGESHLCQTPGEPGFDGLVCTIVRRWPRLGYMLVNGHTYSAERPKRYGFCGPNGRICRDAARGPWRVIQDAAEAAYDRSATCRFTSFVGYEWTGMPSGANLHRNVIFRNAVAQEMPTTYIETPTPAGLWDSLAKECLDRGNGCDVLAIPHNSNVSNGLMFESGYLDGRKIDAAEATTRAKLESLIEITQHKGDSECGPTSNDEECAFEKVQFPRLMDSAQRSKWTGPAPGSFARDAIGMGLAAEARIGTNPFGLGFIGSTDTHFGLAGQVDEDQHNGHGAGLVFAAHGIPPFPDQAEYNPGGLAAIWAEENSRDSLFAAMRRREVYGTSGPRIIVRFFGGWDLPESLCSAPDLAAQGYARGVPMGGQLPRPPARGSAARFAPSFVVSALRDPGHGGTPVAGLERIQIIKVWLEGEKAREQVIDVAGGAEPSGGVDPLTCAPRSPGFDSLCTVWRDPNFSAEQRAAYYVRVLEQPTCRWSTWACLRAGVDCSQPSSIQESLEPCCDPTIPRTIRERAWTSPIWYSPNSVG